MAVLGWSLRHKLATLGLAASTLVGSFTLIPLLGTEFVPKADYSETYVSFHTPVGSSLEVTEMLVRSGAIDVLVVDSVAALTPRAEIEGEMGDSHVGLQARLREPPRADRMDEA